MERILVPYVSEISIVSFSKRINAFKNLINTYSLLPSAITLFSFNTSFHIESTKPRLIRLRKAWKKAISRRVEYHFLGACASRSKSAYEANIRPQIRIVIVASVCIGAGRCLPVSRPCRRATRWLFDARLIREPDMIGNRLDPRRGLAVSMWGTFARRKQFRIRRTRAFLRAFPDERRCRLSDFWRHNLRRINLNIESRNEMFYGIQESECRWECQERVTCIKKIISTPLTHTHTPIKYGKWYVWRKNCV